jgi:PAS domain-containing protein
MGFRWFNTSAARAILLMSGTAILTWGIAHMQFALIAIGLAVLVYTMFTYKRGVKSLKEKCFLMLEAIRNNDYSFRLPTVYHSDNEQVLQDTINQFGNLMNEQKQQMVQREKFYEQIMASVSSGIIVLSDNDFVLQANPAAAKLLGLPVVSTLHQLERYDTEAVNLLRNLQPGERSQLHFLTEKGATYVTNGLPHASKLSSHGFKVFILGGALKATTEAVVGSGAIRSLEAYNFTKGFFGTNGISTQSGYSTPDADEGEVKGEAMKRCKNAYVLADRSKFNRVAPITFGSISSATIITGPLEDKKYRDFTNILEAE